ncbi:S-layer homology domain-containing protein [Sporosalibacterium faouarense]|uniref:S-layer homology domain-containing protein n=1 Tax=Sporosalibacterium faouarense TaxID=516123 RepID=UPI00192CB556|nr:S-layer homology domain-containing protein [Sporosalibacterium faouarense]
MKKILVIILMVAIVLPVVAFGDGEITDISQHWAKSYIRELINKGIIDGYPDGTFKPNQSIQRDSYIKLVVTALGYSPGNAEGYWATNYINKAMDLGLIESDEFDKYNVPINREEMAKIITNATYLNEEKNENINITEIKKLIKDYNSISDYYKESVIDSYVLGLITGKDGGFFDPQGTATRAEASTVITRLLDPDIRQIPEGIEITKPDKDTEDIKLSDLLHKEHTNEDGVDMYWWHFYESAVDLETGLFKEDYKDYSEKTNGLNHFRIKEDAEYMLEYDGKFWNETEPNFMELKEDNIPDFSKRVNNLLSFFVDNAVEKDKYIDVRGESEDGKELKYIRLAFHRNAVGALNDEYIGYYFFPNYEDVSYGDYKVNDNLSKKAFMMISVIDLMPDEYDERFYQDEYKEMLHESLVVCFGEEKGKELFEFMFEEYVEWVWGRSAYKDYGKTYHVAGYRIDVPKNPYNRLEFYFSLE